MKKLTGGMVLAVAGGVATAGDLPVTFEVVTGVGRTFDDAGMVQSIRVGYSGSFRGRPSIASDGTVALSGRFFGADGTSAGDTFVGLSWDSGRVSTLLDSDPVLGAGDLSFTSLNISHGARALPGGQLRTATRLRGSDGSNIDAIVDGAGRVLIASDLRTGGVGPGIEQVTFDSPSTTDDTRPPDAVAFSPNGSGAFAARLFGSSIGSERGVVGVIPQGVTLLARTGDDVGHPDGTPFREAVSVSGNDAGDVAFLGRFVGSGSSWNEYVPLLARDGVVAPVALPGEPVFGTDAVFFGYPSWQGNSTGQEHPKVNAGGDVITVGLIENPGGTGGNAVLVRDGHGLRPVLVEGQTIPVFEGDDQPIAGSEMLQVMLADNGDAFVQNFNSIGRRMIVRPDGSVRVLPGTTRPPGMAPERRWASDPYMGLATMSPNGRVAFFATTLTPNAGDRSSGVWVTDDAGRPHLVMNEREPVEFGNGEILTPLLLQPVPGGTGSDGLTTMVNDRGEVLVLVWFSEEHGWSLVRATVAGLDCPADLNADRRTDFADLSAFLAAFQAGDPAAEFAAPYAHLDFFDIAEYLRWFHRGCPGD